MSLKFAEGFGITRDTVQLGRKWGAVSGAVGTVITGFRDIGLALSTTTGVLTTPAFTDQAEWTFGAALWWSARPASLTAKFELLKAGNPQLAFEFDPVEDGLLFNILVKRGSNLLETVGPFFTRTPAYYEFQATIHTAAGAWEIKRDGVSVGSDTGVNTANEASNDADAVKISLGTGGAIARFGDFVLMDDQGGAMDDFLGPIKVLGIRPESDDANAWIPSTGVDNYVLVDDGAGSPNDADRVTSYTPSDEDFYEYTDLDIPAGVTLYGLILESVCAMESSGSRTLRPKYKNSPSAGSNGTNFLVDSTLFARFYEVWEEEPIATSAWTVAQINDARFGIEVVS
jgi:hypothetical protein